MHKSIYTNAFVKKLSFMNKIFFMLASLRHNKYLTPVTSSRLCFTRIRSPTNNCGPFDQQAASPKAGLLDILNSCTGHRPKPTYILTDFPISFF